MERFAQVNPINVGTHSTQIRCTLYAMSLMSAEKLRLEKLIRTAPGVAVQIQNLDRARPSDGPSKGFHGTVSSYQ